MGKYWTQDWALIAVASLVFGGRSFGQQAPPKPEAQRKPAPTQEKPASAKQDERTVPSVPEMLAEALKGNPDIRVAEARMHEAEAELSRARLLVTQKVLALHRAWTKQQADVMEAEAAFKAADAAYEPWRHGPGLVNANQLAETMKQIHAQEDNLKATKARLTAAKEALAETDAEAQYLLGQMPVSQVRQQAARALSDITATVPRGFETSYQEYVKALVQSGQKALATPMADKIRKALDRPVTVNYAGVRLDEVLKDFERATGIHFHLAQIPGPPGVKLLLDTVPLGLALLAMEDTIPKLRFIPREYGILVTTEPMIPPDAMRLHDFWKARPSPRPKAEIPSRNEGEKPAAGAKGAVQDVDSKTGLVAVSIGSDAGLAVGSTLDVYRVKPKPEYVGTVRVVEVKAAKAIARPKSPLLAGPIRVGDEVATQAK